MRIKRRLAVVFASGRSRGSGARGIALAAPNSTATFKASPSNVPTTTFQAGSDQHPHAHDVSDRHAVHGQGRAELRRRLQGQLERDAEVQQVADLRHEDHGPGDGRVRDEADRQGHGDRRGGPTRFTPACWRSTGAGTGGHVLLFTRANASPPFTISCSKPASNTQGNTNVLLDGKWAANPTALGGDYSGGRQLTFANIPRPRRSR